MMMMMMMPGAGSKSYSPIQIVATVLITTVMRMCEYSLYRGRTGAPCRGPPCGGAPPPALNHNHIYVLYIKILYYY